MIEQSYPVALTIEESSSLFNDLLVRLRLAYAFIEIGCVGVDLSGLVRLGFESAEMYVLLTMVIERPFSQVAQFRCATMLI